MPTKYTIVQTKRMRRCGVAPSTNNFRKTSVTLTNYISSEREFREDKSNNVFREILKCLLKTAKFEFFAKQITYLESSDHPLQNDI